MVMRDYLANLIKAQLDGCTPKNMPEEIEISELIRMARKHHMVYLVLGALLRTSEISDEYKNELKKLVLNSVMRTAVQVAELKEMEKQFETAGVKNQPLKGARLKFIYPSPEMREMSDIDVLVDNASAELVENIMKNMGYIEPNAIRHHDVYKKPPFMVIEVHHAIYDKTVDSKQYLYFESFSKTHLCEGKQFTYDFGLEDFYVYMIAHMAKHFYAKGCGIRNLVDIYVYLKKYGDTMDKAYLEQELDKCGILQFSKHMEKLAFMWLEAGEFDSFYEELFEYMLDCGIYGKDENGIWNSFSKEKMNEKEINSSKLRWWFVFPPFEYMKEKYEWLEKMPILLPWAWFLRGCKGMVSNSGSRKCEMIHHIEQDKIVSRKRIYQSMGLDFVQHEEEDEE